ncbi:helix-turn-helix domain-containing protein [Butyrivibrio sp. AD3002]|uniref:helix-turn-helix domain-containing protein n=1 Tax=Butyrivibrio sp. AD3002 TaxID=1280670 RepID=UPI0003B5C985|nr:helix-turn-helix transcriptional regulator [Butyrivibrio sp. AD3002]
MSVSYKKLQHLMIEKDMSNSDLMRQAHISANIISKIKSGQYIALEKVESICKAMNCTPNDILVFLPESEEENNK